MQLLRWFLTGILALVAGALVNEAVVRISLARLAPDRGVPRANDRPDEWPIVVPQHWPPPDPAHTVRESSPIFEWWIARARTADGSYFAARANWSGWPFRSFVAEDSVEEHPLMPTAVDRMSVFWTPSKPIWGGLLANSAIFGIVLWLVGLSGVQLTRNLIRTVRSRRHLCVSCGYPEGPSSICPECGARHQPLAT